MHYRLPLIVAASLFILMPLSGSTLFFTGNLRTDATVVDCGNNCTLGSSDPDSAYAQWAAVVTPFTLSSAASVHAVTFSFGGGTSGTGATVLPGGLEPYLSLFDAAGNFLTSTFFGTTCPAGANSVAGECLDVLLDAGILPAGNYEITLTAWENLSFAENQGSGTLADGFTGLGNLGNGENLNYAFDIVSTPVAATPEPGSLGLMSLAAAFLAVVRKTSALVQARR